MTLAESRRACDGGWRDPRDGGLHEPRAGEGPPRRQAHGHLGVRLRAVRDADRPRPRFPARPCRTRLSRSSNASRTWTVLPAATPPPIRRLLRRCLEKDRTRRLADMADARLDIDDALSGSEIDAPVALSISRTRERLTWTSSLLLVGTTAAAIVAWATRPVPVPLETTRTILSVAPTGETSGANALEQRVGGARPTRTAVALSPDGKTLVFDAIWGGRQQLYARAMDQLSATPISGTSGGSSPFFSPDGQWVGFGADGELRKVPLSGGPAVTLCKAVGALRGELGRRRHHRVCDSSGTGACGVCRPREALPKRSRPLSQASTVTGCPTCCPAAAL